MIIQKGVEMKGLCRQIKKILRILEVIYARAGNRLIIKGTLMGFDKSRSAHEAGRAIDIESPIRKRIDVYTRIRLSLGLNYIVRQQDTHMHIEWAPMSTETLKVERYVHERLERSVKKC